jgi:hypothetical protein
MLDTRYWILDPPTDPEIWQRPALTTFESSPSSIEYRASSIYSKRYDLAKTLLMTPAPGNAIIPYHVMG